jgi:FkbM family methyltransferase
MISAFRSRLRWFVKELKGTGHPVRGFRRLLWWRVLSACGKTTVVKFDYYDCLFECPPEWRGMSKLAYVMRDSYEVELPHLRNWVKPGDTAVDLGAHYGAFTIALCQVVGPVGRVIAVEPSQRFCAVLKRNIELNKYSCAEVISKAVGNKPGALTLKHHGDPSRAAFDLQAHESAGTTESVEIDTLDSLLSGRVDFIKIDVEGAELAAFKGAEQVLGTWHPIILFEYVPRANDAGTSARQAWEFLASLGYEFSEVLDDGSQRELPTPETSRSGRSANVLATWRAS